LILRSSAGTPYSELAQGSPLTPVMLRIVFIVLVLTALAASSAAASPVVPSNAHRFAHSSAAHPRTIRQSARPSRGRSPARHSTHSAEYRAGYRGHSSKSPHKASAGRVPTAVAGQGSSRHVSTLRVSSPAVVRPASIERTRVVVPPPLKGSFESLARQNERAEADGLERILDEDDLTSRIEQKLLVPVPASAGLVVNANLSENHRYCRPWTADFLSDLAAAHSARFHRPIEVSSAVRTVEYQQQLLMVNGNAAAAEGDIVSPHLTGGTVDVVKQGMTRQELGWMRNWLLAQQLAGTIDVEEEFRQPCFHITVYKNYVSPPPAPAKVPGRRHPAAAAQIAEDAK
jgi:hypothetical protein